MEVKDIQSSLTGLRIPTWNCTQDGFAKPANHVLGYCQSYLTGLGCAEAHPYNTVMALWSETR